MAVTRRSTAMERAEYVLRTYKEFSKFNRLQWKNVSSQTRYHTDFEEFLPKYMQNTDRTTSSVSSVFLRGFWKAQMFAAEMLLPH